MLTLKANQDWIIAKTKEAQAGAAAPLWLNTDTHAPDDRHEAIVFIKPELTSLGTERLPAFLEIFDEALKRFDVEILNIGVLSGTYMGNHNIIMDHYGVMTDVSMNGWKALSEDARKKVTDLYGVPAERVYGGHAFLKQYPAFNTESLNVMWDTIIDRTERLAAGTYSAKIQYGNDPIVVINGSHPGTVNHYCAPDRTTIVMTVRSKTDWNVLRDDMVGLTKVSAAAPTSIRGQFFAKQKELGIPVVTARYNGVHMSAGPLEGMAEIIRFTSNKATGTVVTSEQTNFGAAFIKAGGSVADLQALANNPQINADGKTQSAFDATEVTNMAPAVALLRGALKQAA